MLLAAGCAGALAVLGVLVPHQVPDPTRDPGWLQPAMTSLPPDTKVLSAWDTSAILMWRFPDLDLVANGYGDAYTVPELQRSSDIQSLSPGWQDDLRATGATVAVLPTDNPLADALVRHEHWKVLHRSQGLEMLTAPSADNELGTCSQGSRSRTTASARRRPCRVSTSRSARSSTRSRCDQVGDRGATVRVQGEHRQSVAQAELQHHPLHPAGLGVERLSRGGRAGLARPASRRTPRGA